MKYFIALLFIALLLSVAAALVFVTLPYTISSTGQLLPEREWRLEKTNEGQLVNVTRDNLLNSVTSYSYLEFQQGDHAEFHLNHSLLRGLSVRQGDTVGHITSFEGTLRYLELRGLIEEQRRLLRVQRAGAKPEQIELGRQQIALAERELEAQRRITARIETLHAQGVVSDGELELAQRDYLIKQQHLSIQRAAYQELLSGAKPEEIELIEANIRSLEAQLAQMHGRLQSFYIRAPFDGALINERGSQLQLGVVPDTEPIARVVQVDRMLIILPVELYQLSHVRVGQPVEVEILPHREIVQGQVIRIDNQVQQLNRRQTAFVTAVIEANGQTMFVNSLSNVTIHGGRIPAHEYLTRLFRTVYEN